MNNIEKKNFFFLLHDGGGANNAFPVVKSALFGHNVTIVVNDDNKESPVGPFGRVNRFLNNSGLSEKVSVKNISGASSMEGAFGDVTDGIDLGSVVVISAMDSVCWSCGLSKVASENGVPVFALQDGPGRILTTWRDAESWLPNIAVGNPFDEEILKRHWPTFRGRVIESPYPFLDQYAHVGQADVWAQKIKMCSRLGLQEGDQIVFFVGQIWGTCCALRSLVEALIDFPKLKIVVAPHPRMGECSEESEGFGRLIHEHELYVTDRTGPITYQDALYSADYVVGMSTTGLWEAVANSSKMDGTPAIISYLGGKCRDAFDAEFPQLAGYNHPAAELGCIHHAETPDDLACIFRQGDVVPEEMFKAQCKYAPIDGRCGERVAQAILGYL